MRDGRESQDGKLSTVRRTGQLVGSHSARLAAMGSGSSGLESWLESSRLAGRSLCSMTRPLGMNGFVCAKGGRLSARLWLDIDTRWGCLAALPAVASLEFGWEGNKWLGGLSGCFQGAAQWWSRRRSASPYGQRHTSTPPARIHAGGQCWLTCPSFPPPPPNVSTSAAAGGRPGGEIVFQVVVVVV